MRFFSRVSSLAISIAVLTGLVTVVNADQLPGPSALWLGHREKDANMSLR